MFSPGSYEWQTWKAPVRLNRPGSQWNIVSILCFLLISFAPPSSHMIKVMGSCVACSDSEPWQNGWRCLAPSLPATPILSEAPRVEEIEHYFPVPTSWGSPLCSCCILYNSVFTGTRRAKGLTLPTPKLSYSTFRKHTAFVFPITWISTAFFSPLHFLSLMTPDWFVSHVWEQVKCFARWLCSYRSPAACRLCLIVTKTKRLDTQD